jgi:hypothetical protein
VAWPQAGQRINCRVLFAKWQAAVLALKLYGSMQSRWESVRILLGKHIISQPRRGDEAIESNGEETSISMQPFSGYAVV